MATICVGCGLKLDSEGKLDVDLDPISAYWATSAITDTIVLPNSNGELLDIPGVLSPPVEICNPNPCRPMLLQIMTRGNIPYVYEPGAGVVTANLELLRDGESISTSNMGGFGSDDPMSTTIRMSFAHTIDQPDILEVGECRSYRVKGQYSSNRDVTLSAGGNYRLRAWGTIV